MLLAVHPLQPCMQVLQQLRQPCWLMLLAVLLSCRLLSQQQLPLQQKQVGLVGHTGSNMQAGALHRHPQAQQPPCLPKAATPQRSLSAGRWCTCAAIDVCACAQLVLTLSQQQCCVSSMHVSTHPTCATILTFLFASADHQVVPDLFAMTCADQLLLLFLLCLSSEPDLSCLDHSYFLAEVSRCAD